jgi:hypothetical protein
VQALAPPLGFGFMFGLLAAGVTDEAEYACLAVLLWIALYGCALHAAGFFMPRGIRWFGWIQVVLASFSLGLLLLTGQEPSLALAHGLMGACFGVLHLVYGAYLVATEKRRAA